MLTLLNEVSMQYSYLGLTAVLLITYFHTEMFFLLYLKLLS